VNLNCYVRTTTTLRAKTANYDASVCNRLLGQAKDDTRILEVAAAFAKSIEFTSAAIQAGHPEN